MIEMNWLERILLRRNSNPARENPSVRMAEYLKAIQEMDSDAFRYLPQAQEMLSSINGLEKRVVIDKNPADNGSKKNQDEWIVYGNAAEDNRVITSMGDLYQVSKQLKKDYETGSEERTKAELVLASLRKDFDWSRRQNALCTTTRIIFSPESEVAKIIHHYNCHRKDLIKEIDLEIPVYRGTPITEVVDNVEGLNYLQALLDTKDDKETMIQALEFVGSKKRKKIKIWTPLFEDNKYYTRKERPERAAFVDACSDRLGLDCDLRPDDYCGLARWVVKE